MPAGVVGGRPHVDDGCPGPKHRAEVDGREVTRRGQRSKNRRTVPIHLFHPGEVPRWLGLARQNLPHELVFPIRPERPVESPLIPDGRLRHRSEPLATGRPGAMSRPDLEMIRKRLEPRQTPVELPGSRLRGVGDPGRLLQQIGAAHVADEDEVAGDHPDRLGRRGAVGDHEDQVLRGVARRVNRLNRDVADGDRVAIREHRDVGVGPESVLPVPCPASAHVHPGAGRGRQFPEARHEIRVDVGLGDGHDGETLCRGHLEIGSNHAGRIDHDCRAVGLTPDQIARLRQLLVVESPEIHRASLIGAGSGRPAR